MSLTRAISTVKGSLYTREPFLVVPTADKVKIPTNRLLVVGIIDLFVLRQKYCILTFYLKTLSVPSILRRMNRTERAIIIRQETMRIALLMEFFVPAVPVEATIPERFSTPVTGL